MFGRLSARSRTYPGSNVIWDGRRSPVVTLISPHENRCGKWIASTCRWRGRWDGYNSAPGVHGLALPGGQDAENGAQLLPPRQPKLLADEAADILHLAFAKRIERRAAGTASRPRKVRQTRVVAWGTRGKQKRSRNSVRFPLSSWNHKSAVYRQHCDMNASPRPRRPPLASYPNDQRRHLGRIVRSVVRRTKGPIPLEVGGAVCGRRRAAVGPAYIRGAHGPYPNPTHPRGRHLVHADQCSGHPAVGRHHRPRSLGRRSSPPPRPRGREIARPDRRLVFGYRGVARRVGGDRRQRDYRSGVRSSVFRTYARGDPELVDRCASISL